MQEPVNSWTVVANANDNERMEVEYSDRFVKRVGEKKIPCFGQRPGH
jgi:hypothetical protein